MYLLGDCSVRVIDRAYWNAPDRHFCDATSSPNDRDIDLSRHSTALLPSRCALSTWLARAMWLLLAFGWAWALLEGRCVDAPSHSRAALGGPDVGHVASRPALVRPVRKASERRIVA